MTTGASTKVSAEPTAVMAVARTKGARRTISGTAAYAVLLGVAAAILLPILYAVLGGFKDNGQLAGNPVALIPDPWVFDNYANVLWGENAPAFWGELFNSVIVAIVAVGVTVGCASLAAFVFARIRFRGREAMYTLFVFGLLFPTAVAILPLYVLIRQLGLSGNLLGVALPQAAFGLPLSIVILRPFFRSIPMELEDAARIDGCGSFGFFWRVLLPLSRPALATVSVLAIVTTWNAFILPLVVLNSEDQWTLPLGVMNFASTYSSDAARTLAFTVVSLIPALVFYVIAERHIVGGLTAGSVKG
jgi:raffinose/stachyose/melibiose transport system permease protein